MIDQLTNSAEVTSYVMGLDDVRIINLVISEFHCKTYSFLPLNDETISTVVIVIVSGSDGQLGGRVVGRKRFRSEPHSSKTPGDRPLIGNRTEKFPFGYT